VNLCVGIGTDRCSVMTSEKVGAVKEIQKEASNAFRCPCFNHALNLTISVSSSVVSIRNFIGVIKEPIAFLILLRNRRDVVDYICVRKIKKLCETRWVERFEALADFSSSFEAIMDVLDEISEWESTNASKKAKTLTNSLRSFKFRCIAKFLYLIYFCL
jgi:hypothetical protein